MIIHIINRQNICKPIKSKIKAVLNFFMAKAAAGNNWKELSLVLTDDSGIRQINRQFLDRDYVTDVISFMIRPRQKNGHPAGEVVINVERAIQEGKKRRGFEHELALYLAHGCDHLAGHNDRTVKGRRKMRRRELRWLREAARRNLLSGLFGPVRKRRS